MFGLRCLCFIASLTVGKQYCLGVILTRKKERTHIPIECSFNSDISFKFTNTLSNKTQTIAGCSTTINSCYLSNKTLAQSYAIAISDVGGTLFIIDVSENTAGTYTCYETYNTSNYATLDLHSKDEQSSTQSPPGHIISVSDSILVYVGLVIDGLQTVLLIFCLVGIAVINKYCKQGQLFGQGQRSYTYRQVLRGHPISEESNNEATDSATATTKLVEEREIQSARTIKSPTDSVNTPEGLAKKRLVKPVSKAKHHR